MFNRRQFIQTSTAATLGVAMANPISAFSKNSTFLFATANTRALTPYFLAEDLLRLLQLTEFDKMMRQALTVNQEHFQLGKAWSIPIEELLKVARDSKAIWKSELEQDRAQTQYALVCGWVAHRTFEKYLPKETGNQLSERAIYQDAHLMKMLQNADVHRKQVPIDEPLEGVSEAEVTELLHIIQQRNMIRMHTIRPEFSGVSLWLEQFLAYYNQMKKDNKTYAKVYCNPTKSKVQEYIHQTSFYNENDENIQAARQLQLSLVTGGNNRLQSAKPMSIYGKALQDGLNRMKICENYVMGKTGENALEAVMQ